MRTRHGWQADFRHIDRRRRSAAGLHGVGLWHVDLHMRTRLVSSTVKERFLARGDQHADLGRAMRTTPSNGATMRLKTLQFLQTVDVRLPALGRGFSQAIIAARVSRLVRRRSTSAQARDVRRASFDFFLEDFEFFAADA